MAQLYYTIADRNHDIVNEKPAPGEALGSERIFTSSGYYTHNTEGYVPKPETLIIPSRPPPAERPAEDQPFFHVPRNPDDPRTRVDISSGSAS